MTPPPPTRRGRGRRREGGLRHSHDIAKDDTMCMIVTQKSAHDFETRHTTLQTADTKIKSLLS